MENHRQSIIEAVSNKSLANAFVEFSSRISIAPGKRTRVNGYNNHTPIGSMTRPNPNYNVQLTEWKKSKLFPYFLELGFLSSELSDAWKVFKSFPGR